MTNLSVNIDKIAFLRNARGGNVPNVQQVALDCERFGAQGITVHPRPDERHIRRSDVLALRPLVRTEFNIEGYPSPEFMELVLQVKPTQVTLVPDAPDVITSNMGWDVEANFDLLCSVVDRLKEAGIRTSIFVAADPAAIRLAAKTDTDRVELYTGPYAAQFEASPEQAVEPFVEAANVAHSEGLGLNAGHDLNLQNLKYFKDHVPHLIEVSIGHSLVSDALYLGMEKAIQSYKACLV